MPIQSITSDPETLTLTVMGEYAVPVQRLWEVWSNPRQLERFWGPPQWPATFTKHELKVGGEAHYFMTGPQGEKAEGYWRFEVVEQYRRMVVVDGFSNNDGTPNEQMPKMRMEFKFESTAQGSRFVSVTTFPSLKAMEQLAAMGMVEGSRAALGQIDEVLEDLRHLSAGMPAALEVLDDTIVVVRRMVRGRIAEVWRAFNEKELLQKWLLGPDGWVMPVCEVAAAVGDHYRYEWEKEGGGGRFGFTGTLLEQEVPRRAVTTEQMIGMEETTQNELILTPKPGDRTLISITIEYPSKELRDFVLGTGMIEGMEASYARLEGVNLANSAPQT
jgi:uncharacterized protein YndB with AHSA1/START domain